jgi:twitching motility protein PilT
MQTFDQSIFSLFQQQLISYEEALRWASNVDEFKLKVQGISTTSDVSRDQMANTIFSKPINPGRQTAGQAPRPGAATARPGVPAQKPAAAAAPKKEPEITRFGS